MEQKVMGSKEQSGTTLPGPHSKSGTHSKFIQIQSQTSNNVIMMAQNIQNDIKLT